MAGFNSATDSHLTRANLWTNQVKDVLEADVFASGYVSMITDFPDGDTWNMPSIGQHEVNDYEEGQAVKYTAMDTGNFTFTITEYKQAATWITNKEKQDMYYMNQLVSSFVPKQARALAAAFETDVLAIGPDGQTASDFNTINSAAHRWVGQGTNSAITLEDFKRAKYALQKAHVPMTNLVAIVDPSIEYTLATQDNLVNLINNPRWEGVIRDDLSTGMKFITNIYGFDVYVSHFLKSGMTETIGATSVTTDGVANLFFSATSDVLPFIGSIRQPAKVDSEYNKDKQRDEYVTTMRYGVKLFRPENLVTILSAATIADPV